LTGKEAAIQARVPPATTNGDGWPAVRNFSAAIFERSSAWQMR
jgi:hypothetical protein